jgi:hypothetical protein
MKNFYPDSAHIWIIPTIVFQSLKQITSQTDRISHQPNDFYGNLISNGDYSYEPVSKILHHLCDTVGVKIIRLPSRKSLYFIFYLEGEG